MRGLRSGLALHALAVHAERDQPPTRPTRTPVLGLVRAPATPVQDFSCFIRIRRRASRQGRFRRWPTAVAARALRSPTAFRAFPGKASQFLRNTQHCFKEWMRVARIEYRSGMAYRMEIFHLLDLPSLEPGEFSHQEELRVRQADGVTNDQSCTEALASQSPRGSSNRRTRDR